MFRDWRKESSRRRGCLRSALTRDATSANKVVKAELGNTCEGREADAARGGSMCRRVVLARASFFPKIKRKKKTGPLLFFVILHCLFHALHLLRVCVSLEEDLLFILSDFAAVAAHIKRPVQFSLCFSRRGAFLIC